MKPLKPLAWRLRAAAKRARERRKRYFAAPGLVTDPELAREELVTIEAARAAPRSGS